MCTARIWASKNVPQQRLSGWAAKKNKMISGFSSSCQIGEGTREAQRNV